MKRKLKPVIVYIHGGLFLFGSNSRNMLGPEFLLLEDIVLVVPNFRLGLLGFLSLENLSLDVPGNAGLKDQVLALQWVQSNIKAFGGDTNNVTMMGHSTGAISVHYHLLSECSKGLFHKIVILSGTVFWEYIHQEFKFDFRRFSEILHEKVETEEEFLNLLQTLTSEVIVETQEKYFAVCIKNDFH